MKLMQEKIIELTVEETKQIIVDYCRSRFGTALKPDTEVTFKDSENGHYVKFDKVVLKDVFENDGTKPNIIPR